MRIRNICVVFISIMALTLAVLPKDGFCVPASPAQHTLRQPDGSSFQAKQWGDEFYHGWETADGYSIVFDKYSQSWRYAVHDVNGDLVASSMTAGKDSPPTDAKSMRPTGKALSKVVQSRSVRLAAPRGGAPMRKAAPTTGTNNILVALVNFIDTTPTYTVGNFESVLFGTGTYSLKDYYEEVSYGNLSLSSGPGGIIDWFTASQTHDYYGQNDMNGYDMNVRELVTEAVTALDLTGFDFAPYDRDGDCYVDTVALVYQGTEESSSGNPNDIWPHSWSINDYTTQSNCIAGGNIIIRDYIAQGEINAMDNLMATIGTIAHEYGHAVGLPDLYDTDYTSEGIGEWSLMASGSYNMVSRLSDRPAHLDAWSKFALGWITPTLVTTTLVNEPIAEVENSGQVFQLLSGTPMSGEYFLVENRQRTGFDAGLPGAGLLIWHIDGAVVSAMYATNEVNNSECVPGGTPSCTTQHYGIALVQADNLWSLERFTSLGDPGDPYPGSRANTVFSTTTLPSSKLYDGSASYAGVSQISASGATMTATLTPPGCSYALSPASQSFINSGGTGTIALSGGCAWSATTASPWITITSGSAGTGNGTIAFSVSANLSGPARQGSIAISSQTFAVNQAGRDLWSGGGSASGTVSSGECFIATAAYGSYLDPHVQALRDFRDNYLITNAPGRMFVMFYYSVSPPIADLIYEHETLRAATRIVLTPIVYGVQYPWAALMFLGLMTYLLARVVRRNKIS